MPRCFSDMSFTRCGPLDKRFRNICRTVFFIAVILVVAYYAVKVVKFLFLEIEKGTITLPGF